METNGRVKKRNRSNVTGNPRTQHYHLCIYDMKFILLEKRSNAMPSDDDSGHSNASSDAEVNRNIQRQFASSSRQMQLSASVPVNTYVVNNANFWHNMGGSKDTHRMMGPPITIGQTIAKEFYDEARGEARTYKGTVSAWDGAHYQIVYSDGDKEDLSSNEVQLYNC